MPLPTATVTPMPSATPTQTPNVPPPPTVTTGEASNVTSNSATLNGTVSTGQLITAWYEYGATSGLYDSTSMRHNFSGPGPYTVSINVSGLTAVTTYYYRLAAFDGSLAGTSSTAYGSEKSFITLAVTPTPECEIESVDASPKTLKLKRDEGGDVTVTVICADGSPVVGESVTAKIKSGKKRISISPQSADTGIDGRAIFTITATKKTGNAKVKFKTASGLKTIVTVKVRE